MPLNCIVFNLFCFSVVLVTGISVLGRMAVMMDVFLCWGAVLRINSLLCVVCAGKCVVLAGQVPFNCLIFCHLSFLSVVIIGISVLGRMAVVMATFLCWGALLHVSSLLFVVGAGKDVVLAGQVLFDCLVVRVIIYHRPFLSRLVFVIEISLSTIA